MVFVVRDILRLYLTLLEKKRSVYRYMFSKNILKKLDFKIEIV